MKTAVLVVTALVAGGLGGWAARGLPGSTPGRPPASSLPAVSAVRCPGGASLADVRALLDERLPAARAEGAPAPAPTAAAPAPEHGERMAAVGAAIADGVWTDEDRALLRRNLIGLPREEAKALMSELFVALNEGRLRPETRGPLY